jgi:hypothetical protein
MKDESKPSFHPSAFILSPAALDLKVPLSYIVAASEKALPHPARVKKTLLQV